MIKAKLQFLEVILVRNSWNLFKIENLFFRDVVKENLNKWGTIPHP